MQEAFSREATHASHGALLRSSVAAAIASVLLLPGEARPQDEPESVGDIVPGSKVRLSAPTAVRSQIQGTVMEMGRGNELAEREGFRTR